MAFFMLTNPPKKSKIFISYARADAAEVELLDVRLRLGGLLTWRDLKDSKKGSPLEPQIEAALRNECSMFMMYLTPRAAASDYVNKIEVKLAKELWAAKQLTIIPVFRGITPKEAATRVQEQIGFDISPFDGMVLPQPLSRWERLWADLIGNVSVSRNQLSGHYSELTRRILETHLKASVSGTELALRLHAYEFALGPTPADVELDWSPVLRVGMNGWNDRLLPALRDVRQAMTAATSARQLTIEGGGHLSVGLILGYTFSSASGFGLLVKQNGVAWASAPDTSLPLPLIKAEEVGSPSQSDVSLEVSVSNDICGAVDGLMRSHPGKFRKRVKLALTGGPSRQGVRDRAHANAIATQIFQEIRAIRQDPNLKTIHIFLSTPFAVAVLAGHMLNACGPLQMYEFEKTKNEYVPSFTVGTGGAP